jgi:hypothetical protein
MLCDICFLEFPEDEIQYHKIQCLHEQTNAIDAINRPIIPLELTDKQVQAIKHCQKKAKIFSKNVKPNLFEKFITLGYTNDDFNKTIDFFKKHVPIVVHIDLNKTLDFIIKDDHLRNRFETGTSGGCLDIDYRSNWEDNLFRDIYKDAEPYERVKYGAINTNCDPNGVVSAHWYGRSYFVMKDDVKIRTTFVYGDSSLKDWHIATFKYFYNILYYIPDIGLKSIIDVATGRDIKNKLTNSAYVEAQIHGPVRFDRDIEMLVVDDSHQYDQNIIQKIDQFSNNTGIPWIFKHET